VGIVLERGGDALEDTVPLDEDMTISVDEHVADRRVAQQRLERSETEDVVEDFGEERFTLAETDRRRLLGEEERKECANLTFRARTVGVRQRFQVQAIEQLAVNRRTQLEILLADRLVRSPGN
jgi:hypothetical protein